MDLHGMLNIRGINIIEEIENGIMYVKNELNGLITNQMCKIYNSHLLDELKKRHLQVRLINTLDINLDYEHYFVLISGNNEYFIADLTYSQFNSEKFNDLKNKGYIKVNDELLNEYLSIISRNKINNYSCDDLFFMEIDERKL